MSNSSSYNGSYGFSAEVQRKQAAKYDKELEKQLHAWIEDKTKMKIGDNFAEGLKNGIILCKLLNKLQPKTVRDVATLPRLLICLFFPLPTICISHFPQFAFSAFRVVRVRFCVSSIAHLTFFVSSFTAPQCMYVSVSTTMHDR